MRKITTHQTNPANDQLTVYAVDGPGIANANHHYVVDGIDHTTNATLSDTDPLYDSSRQDIVFQYGPIGENGVNGSTHEVFLAILIDRLGGFQAGEFACRENANALRCLIEALFWLKSRTRRRIDQNVEGTHQKTDEPQANHDSTIDEHCTWDLMVALDAAHFYIDASDEELREAGMDRETALVRARELRDAAMRAMPETPPSL